MSIVRDKLWLWGHEEGSHNEEWDLPAASQITPAQAAENMGLPNVIMVRYRKDYDAEAYAASLRCVDRVIWSIVGNSGINEGIEMAPLRAMAANYPNWRGVMMDDFFLTNDPGATAVHTVEDLQTIQNQLDINRRKLDLWVVLYDHQLHLPIENHLAQCDVLTYWTWRAQDLDKLEANFARAEALAPNCRKVLGCYMWDYGDKRPLSLELMQRQCELGLQWLRSGRIDGMIFLASCICDLDIEAVNWTREWIREVGEEPLSSG